MLIGSNWLLFIWAVNHHHMSEASLGHFINLLANFARYAVSGRTFPTMAMAGGRASIRRYAGAVVDVRFTSAYRPLKWCLPLPYGIACCEKIGIDAQTGILADRNPLTVAVYLFSSSTPQPFTSAPTPDIFNTLLASADVLTTMLLLLFTTTANRLRLLTIGFFQYLGPALMFLLAVSFCGEALSADKLYTFAFIWLALGVFIATPRWPERRPQTA
ncbi:MAG: Protein RarD [Sodalis sp.]|nr:MAG: Protein RarD [Sodalis sp.]